MTTGELKRRLRNSPLHPRGLAQAALWRWVEAEGGQLEGRVLDVGCGRKPYAPLLPRVVSHIGLDLATTMHGMGAVDVVGSTLHLPFRDGAFDGVLCTEIIEHTPEPGQAVAELARVTRPGGRLLLSAPLSEQLHEQPHDYFRFTPHGLRYLLQREGWEVQRITARGGPWVEIGYRASSLLYTELGARRRPDGGLTARPILGPPVVAMAALVQLIAGLVDRMLPSELSSIGYGVVAQRREEVR